MPTPLPTSSYRQLSVLVAGTLALLSAALTGCTSDGVSRSDMNDILTAYRNRPQHKALFMDTGHSGAVVAVSGYDTAEEAAGAAGDQCRESARRAGNDPGKCVQVYQDDQQTFDYSPYLRD